MFSSRPNQGDDFGLRGSPVRGCAPVTGQLGGLNLGEFARYADGLPLFVWISAPDGTPVWANATWYTFTKLPPGSARTFRGVATVIHPDDVDSVISSFVQAVKTRTTYELQHRMKPVDAGNAAYRWFLSRNTPHFGPDGSLAYWLGTGMDIHNSKLLADQASETFRMMGDVVPQMMWVAGADGWIDWYNRRWYEYTGQTPDGAQGWGWQEVHHPDDLPQVIDRWATSIETGAPFEMEFRLRGADGNFRWFLTRAVALRSEAGKIVRWYGTNTDIDAARRQRARDAFFARVGNTLARTLSLDDTLRAITRLVVPEFADWVMVNLPDADGHIRLVETNHSDPEKLAEARALIGSEYGFASGDYGSAAVIRTGRPRHYPSVSADDLAATIRPDARAIVRSIGIGSAVIVPMMHAGKSVGTLSLMWGPGSNHYDKDDVAFFEHLAASIAPAIGNAASYERERRIAQTFQQAAMNSELPAVPGLIFDAIYEAGKAEAQVGGDWYDAFPLGDGRVVVSVGDVAGSGLDAAVTMSNVRQSIRTAALINPEPIAVLDAVDRIVRATGHDLFVTAFVGVIDPVHSELSYASAGHPPALLLNPNRTVTVLDHGALPLGLRERSMQRASIVALAPASMIVLYTDGLTEVGRDAIAGEASVISAIQNAPKARGAAHAVYRSVMDGRAPLDDIAILTIGVSATSKRPGVTRWSFEVRDANAARKARHEFAERLRGSGMTRNDLADAELVFSELIGNVVRYAAGRVTVSLDQATDQPVLHVLDEGAGFEYNERLPADPLQERGRGLFIVSNLTDELTVSPRVGGGSHARAVLARRIMRR